jgi:hypothetical protein
MDDARSTVRRFRYGEQQEQAEADADALAVA